MKRKERRLRTAKLSGGRQCTTLNTSLRTMRLLGRTSVDEKRLAISEFKSMGIRGGFNSRSHVLSRPAGLEGGQGTSDGVVFCGSVENDLFSAIERSSEIMHNLVAACGVRQGQEVRADLCAGIYPLR